MAVILEFRASREERAVRPRRRKLRSAEIVIFPGVRYERWRDQDGKSDALSASISRDVLKLVE